MALVCEFARWLLHLSPRIWSSIGRQVCWGPCPSALFKWPSLICEVLFFSQNDSFVTHWLMWPMFVWQMRLNFLVFSYFLYLFGFVLPLSFSLCTLIFLQALTLPVFLISPSSALFATMFGVRFLSRNICVVCTFVYFWSVNYEESWPFNSLLITV